MVNLTFPGLYFKLHNRHRPFAMKKQEIKRRKRVMPAEQILHHQQTPEHPRQNYHYEQPISPNQRPASYAEETPQSQSRQHNDLPMHSGRKSYPDQERDAQSHQVRGPAPLPADFTTYRPSPSSLPPASSPSGYAAAANESNTRKRNFAETEEHASSAGRAAAQEEQLITQAQRASLEAAIDPLLSAAAGEVSEGSSHGGGRGYDTSKQGKSKEELEADVKRMKELLMLAEGELARMNNGEQEGRA
jgi:GATA-binding protein, other eukaryote